VICSEQSLALGEELVGTAPEEERVLVVERSGPWGRDATERVPPELLERAAELGARVQVVRRRTARYECERPQVWLAHVGGRLERLDGEPVAEPLVLVCTHSTRDPCCARNGLPLHRALARFEPWHSSHLGGHRFAGTLAVLPAGVWLGRVPPDRAEALVGEVLDGRLPLEHLRGVAGRPAAVQAAELHARRVLGETRIDAVQGRLDGGRVRLRTPRGEIDATARWEPTGTVRPLSCGPASKTEDPGRWVIAIPTLDS
jgi:hypothetical protein